MPAIIAAASAGAASATVASGVSIWRLGLFFLKVGAVMFGGGYVLVAYIEGGLVGTYGLTQQQLIDAVAIGQLTPGPLLSTATFVGYLLAGVPGAAAATVGILLPSFFFVEVANPLIPRLRRSRLASLFLDAVVAASIGLILAVAIKLAGTTMVAWQSWLIALPAAGASLRWKVSPAWLVVAGAAAGRLLA
jgi:chromate transporter